MSEENKDKSRGLFLVIAVAIALPLLYVLSVGPSLVIWKKFPKTQPAMLEIYFPLIWLEGHTVLQKPLEWYADLWED